MAHAQLPVKGRGGEGASRGNSAGLAHETTTAFQRRGDTMEPGTAGGEWLRQVCVRDESLDRGRGPERGGSLGARARARSRQLCDPMRTRGEVVRTTGDELAQGGGGGGDWESRRGGRDELIGLAGAWTRLGGIRSAEADRGSGLGVDGRDCWPASRLPAGVLGP